LKVLTVTIQGVEEGQIGESVLTRAVSRYRVANIGPEHALCIAPVIGIRLVQKSTSSVPVACGRAGSYLLHPIAIAVIHVCPVGVLLTLTPSIFCLLCCSYSACFSSGPRSPAPIFRAVTDKNQYSRSLAYFSLQQADVRSFKLMRPECQSLLLPGAMGGDQVAQGNMAVLE